MDQLHNYGDERQTAFCVHCGGDTSTLDHVPSRVFLDEPYPQQLPKVRACYACNESFSLDEEYVACLVECVIAGSVEINDIRREKIRRILLRKPALAARLSQARHVTDNGVFFSTEDARIRNVVLKLARGHAAFEQNEPQLNKPSSVSIRPLVFMDTGCRNGFMDSSRLSSDIAGWPEVGSRAMQRIVIAFKEPMNTEWIVVQPERYRYLTSVGDGLVVRLIIGEYLGCEVTWK